jgi:ATP-binding protein involved in chromosome partitioning
MNLEEQVIQTLNSIVDPFSGMSLKQMNLKYRIAYVADTLELQITAGFPSLLLEHFLKEQILKHLQHLLPHCSVSLIFHQAIRAHKTQLMGKGLRGIKNTIAIASGKGGVGKSTVTLNLASALTRLGARVGILDADLYGPSMPLMLGTKESIQIQDDFYLPIISHGIQTMSIGYLTQSDQALIWRGPMLAKSLIQMINQTRWDNLDYLLIDLPPGTGDIQLTLVQKIPLTAAIVVTTPQNIATLDAQKAITMFRKTSIDVLGIIENMSTHRCSQCGHEEAIFGAGGANALCQNHQYPLLGQLPLDGRIRTHCDEGKPTVFQEAGELTDAFIRTALRSAIELANKPINYADKFPEILVQ